MKRLPFRVGLRLPCVLSTAGLDNQLAAVCQQGNVELALFRELFLSPFRSSSEESSATPKRAALPSEQDTNTGVAPVVDSERPSHSDRLCAGL